MHLLVPNLRPRFYFCKQKTCLARMEAKECFFFFGGGVGGGGGG